jgi:hypothetical protein
MQTEEKLTAELGTTSTLASLAKQCTALLDQPPHIQVIGLTRLCQQLSQQSQVAPETCQDRNWWRLFHQAGIRLREALDQAKAQDYQGLTDQETEQAYFVLIHVAYFFMPGGAVEAMWPQLRDHSGDQQQAKPPANEALRVTFGTATQASASAQGQHAINWMRQRFNRLLGRNTLCRDDAVGMGESGMSDPVALEKETAHLPPAAPRRFSDGTHPGC